MRKIISPLWSRQQYAYINRLPKRADITDGLPSEVLLDLLVQLYNPQACKLAVRTILRQNDNNEIKGYEVGKYRRGHYKSMDRAYSEAFKSLKDVLEHKIPKILSLFESIVVFVAKQEGIGVETFSLSRVRRYYETGVKSLLGEALIEYGFPTDAIRRIEENHKKIKSMTVSEAKEYCRLHFREVQLLLDTYERGLFIKAMRTF